MLSNERLNQKIIKISQILDIRELDVLTFLYYLSFKDSIKIKLLIRNIGQPETQTKRLLKAFSEFLREPSQSIVIKKEYRQKIRNFSKDKIKQIKFINQELIEKLWLKDSNLRPLAKRNFDQFYATAGTVVKRALKMAEKGDLWQREIVFLGDDDLTSISVALTKQAKRIVVFEIDKRINDLIKNISKQERLNIEVIKYDLRKSLPKKYLNSFDAVFTDPPYTFSGISVFLNQAIKLIKRKYTSRIYLCYGNSDRAREREVKIQKLIGSKGLLIKSKLNQFNKYYGAESISSSSSLYLLDWTPGVKITISNKSRFYSNE